MQTCTHCKKFSLDEQNLTVGKKIRETDTQKIPLAVVVGDKEVNDNMVSLRELGEDKGVFSLKEFSENILKKVTPPSF